jgi:hypothetical protein
MPRDNKSRSSRAAVEGGMKIGKESGVLGIDLVGIHGHNRDVVMFPFDLPRHVNTPFAVPRAVDCYHSPSCVLSLPGKLVMSAVGQKAKY